MTSLSVGIAFAALVAQTLGAAAPRTCLHSDCSAGRGRSAERDHLLLQVSADEHVSVSQTVREKKHQRLHNAAPDIQVVDRQLLVDGSPLHLKGVNWNPVAKGGVTPRDLDFKGFVAQDAKLMAEAGVNVIRTYEAIEDTSVLDTLWASGIWVMNTVYIWGGSNIDVLRPKVNAVKEHPAILMWVVGNEWNYNGLYNGLSFQDSLSKVAEAVALIKTLDSRPVSTVYGEMPSNDVLTALSSVDVWGINAYRGISFGDLFNVWANRSNKPMYLGEYGADAWNALKNGEDQEAQALATSALTEEIVEHSAVSGGSCIGGVIFELADEWYKDKAGSPSVHDVGGVAPGGGPYPDSTFNEEWWGLVDIDRQPRRAYTAFKAVAIPTAAGGSTLAPSGPKTCRTASQGDDCYGHVTWAMEKGIIQNPEWYLGLSADSSFEDFQTHLHNTGVHNGACPPSCRGRGDVLAVSPTAVPTSVLTVSPTRSPTKSPTTSRTASPSVFQTPLPTSQGTTTATDACAWWCAGHNSKWTEKCRWSVCRDCSNCPSPLLDVCEWWCSGLEDPCLWQLCQGCNSCEGLTTPPSPAPSPSPSPAPSSTPSQAAFVADPCGKSWPWNDISIQSAESMALQGTTIRTDGGVKLCKDCAVRCWLQMKGQCVGVAWEGSNNRCTYFSHIDRVVVSSGSAAVTKA